jgi:hypothetical protein
MTASERDVLDKVVEELRELRREVRQHGATLVLLIESVQTHGIRVAALEKGKLRTTPVPLEDV